MQIHRVFRILIFNSALCFFAVNAFSMTPKTTEDFKRLADQVAESSEAHQRISEEHGRMVQQYKNALHGQDGSLTKDELKDLIGHCETIVQLADETAQRMKKMSKIYRAKATGVIL